MTPDEADRIERRLEAFGIEVREALKKNTQAIDRMGVLVHSPGECDIKKTVAELKSWKDKVNGQGAILVFFVVSAASVVGGLIVKLWK